MGEINLANSLGRDAVVATSNVNNETQIRWLDDRGRQASNIRMIKSTLDHDLASLSDSYESLDAIAEALIAKDPEIDLENTGRLLNETSRVYIDSQRKIVRNVHFVEEVKDSDGKLRERRPRRALETNLKGDSPLRWSGIFIPKKEAVRKFVFSGKLQIQHINGLTYDFLFAMAKDLEARDSLMMVGAGPKSNQPLVLRRGGAPYRGFLEGRTEGESYQLVLHFSNLELRSPQLNAKTAGRDRPANNSGKSANPNEDKRETEA